MKVKEVTEHTPLEIIFNVDAQALIFSVFQKLKSNITWVPSIQKVCGSCCDTYYRDVTPHCMVCSGTLFMNFGQQSPDTCECLSADNEMKSHALFVVSSWWKLVVPFQLH